MATPRSVKVGAFVLAGLAASGAIIFMIGEERQLFQPKVEYQTVFDDVQGLKRGSPVRMGGVDVGIVNEVGYSEDAKDPHLYVTLEIVEDESRRIRKDSVARIEGKGMLGDKMISISVGSAAQPPIQPGDRIPSEGSQDLSEAIGRLASISAKTEKVLSNLESASGTLADKELHEDLKQSVHSLSNILKSMDEGQGYAARLLHDPAEADNLSKTLASFRQSSAELNRTLRGINQTVDRVNHGPGFAHEVIYGDGPGKTMEQFGNAAEEVAITLKGVREGNGLAKGLLYGDEGDEQLMANLNEMSGDLKHIVKDVRAGKGTLGALLVDPSVYEDLKMLLGNVERNKTLRALVRYSIKRDEGRAPSVEVTDPGPEVQGGARALDSVPVGKSESGDK